MSSNTSTVTVTDTALSNTSSSEIPAVTDIPVPGLESMFEKFVSKVDEDRKIVIEEMKTVMMTKLKEKITAALDESLQRSIASLKTEVFTELKEKYDGELTEIRSTIDELKASKTNHDIDTTKIVEISSRLDSFENPEQSKVMGLCLNEIEERINRKKTLCSLVCLKAKAMMQTLEKLKNWSQSQISLMNSQLISTWGVLVTADSGNSQ